MQASISIPSSIGDFELTTLIGRGGSADVYSAVHTKNGRRCALKVLKLELGGASEARSAFLEEALFASLVAHPNVARVVSSGRSHSDPNDPTSPIRDWIATELAPGQTLSAIVREHGPLSNGDTLALASMVLDALQTVHDAGVVHRDVTPSNILYKHTPGESLDLSSVRLIDFGIAGAPGTTAVSSDRTGPHAPAQASLNDGAPGVLGNPLYISPEQARGAPVFAAADLYELGGSLFFALTGSSPFPRNDPLASMAAHVSDPPVAPSTLCASVTPELDQLVLRALHKDPEQRYESASAMLADIRSLTSANMHGGDVLAAPGIGQAEFLASPDEIRTDLLPLYPRPRSEVPMIPRALEPVKYRGTRADALARSEAQAPEVAPTHSSTSVGITPTLLTQNDTPNSPGQAQHTTRPRVMGVFVALASAALISLGAFAVVQALGNSTDVTPAPVPAVTPIVTPEPDTDPGDMTETTPEPMDLTETDTTDQPVERVDMPELIGLSLGDAQNLLEGMGLQLSKVRTAPSEQPRDTVIASSRESGSAVKLGSRVTLTVASGLNRVPNVVGMSGTDARTALEAAGFIAEITSEDGTLGGDGGENDTLDWSYLVLFPTPGVAALNPVGGVVMLTLALPDTGTEERGPAL